MDEREELKRELEEELKWVLYRQGILDIIEEKLLQMKELAEVVKQGKLSGEEVEALNIKINKLAVQVKALDSESRKIEDRKILE